jgi:PQQ-dependent dehydrogenase (methanol/ethanol family)
MRILAFAVVAASVFALVGGASARRSDTVPTTNWLNFGNTVDENRYSPLTQITPSNVDQLGRVFTADLNKFVPGIKKGQQSYPIVVNGTVYMTSGDDQVFAINGTTGDMIWHYAPDNLATFKNYGIVANRGVTYCDNRIFLLTLDMTIVAIDPATGKQLARVPIDKSVPGAVANYGYSETSAPICANHLVIAGAAGSDYGVRGFVMAWHTNLTPAWANPFWTIPPAGQEWRKAARLIGGCTNWTPETVDPTTNTLYFGTAGPSPAYYPSLRPGSNPRCTSLIALDLSTGKLKWWQQMIARNEWAYDASQPPLVYTTKIGGHTRRIVSIATMEGMWFAFDAATGQPIYSRVKVIDNVEHPDLQPGKPVVVYPSSLGGLNYSPASYDPQTNMVYNAAAETAVVMEQQTPAEEQKQQLLLGNTFLGLANGDFGTYLASGWHDYGSVSAIDVGTGQRVWKVATPQPERGGVTTTASGLAFAGGGDGVLRAFDAKTGKVLWTFQTGRQIAAGASIYAVNGTEYVAITVGGTTTSSNGGTVASQLQVFALGASQTQSPAFTIAYHPPLKPTRVLAGARSHSAHASRAVHVSAAAIRAAGNARIATPQGMTIKAWDPNTSNTQDVQGRVLLSGQPVAGVVVGIQGWSPAPTGNDGSFTYPVDVTMADRHLVKVVDVSHATIGGKPLTPAQSAAVKTAKGAFSMGYSITGLSAHKGKGGTIVVDGQLTYGNKQAPLPVGLYSYLLTGTITYANGAPVQGAVVTTRTNDHKFWTYSTPTSKSGRYSSFLVAADQEGDNPVPMTVEVAVGQDAYTEPLNDFVNFALLKSATLDIQLPAAAGAPLVKSTLNPQTIPGAIYAGLLLGVAGKGHMITPVSATWPDANGNFELVLPASASGLTVTFWQADKQFFSTSTATPGGTVDLGVYPKAIPSDAPQGIAKLALP